MPRSFVGAFGTRAGKIGHQPDPALSFTCELRGAGSGALPPEVDELMRSVFGVRTLDAGNASTVGAGSTSTVVNLSSTTGYSVGNAVAVETATAGKFEVGWIESIQTNVSLTLTHALTFPPSTGKLVKPSLTFKPTDTTHPSLSFQIWLDADNRISFLGCKGSVKIDAPAPGAIATASFTFKAISWKHVNQVGGRPTPTYDSTIPPTLSKFKLDATLTDVKAMSWDLGQSIGRKMSQNAVFGTFAQLVTNREVKGSFQAYDVDDSQYAGWNSGTEFAIAQQWGDTQFNTIAYQLRKAQRAKVAYGDDAGLTTDQIDFQANITSGNDEARLAYL